MTAARFRVSGRVQGVGFRWATARVADQLGVSGWVANRSDGTVSVHAEGADAALTALGAWLEAGPASARVDSVERSEAAVEGHAGFAVRR